MSFYEFILNKETNTHKIDIFGEISWWDDNDAKSFKTKLKAVGNSDVEIHINSPGGFVYDGVTINNLLKDHQGKVKTIVKGFAGSAASVVFVAGDEREMPSNTNLMIHPPLLPQLFNKNAKELREHADNLDVIQESAANSYREVMKSPDDIDELMKKTTYFTADKALEDGFATKVTGKTKIKNCFDFKELGYNTSEMPKNILQKYDKNHKSITKKIIDKLSNKDKEIEEMELKEMQKIMETMKATVEGLQAKNDDMIKKHGEIEKIVNTQKEVIEKQATKITNLQNTNNTSAVDLRKAGNQQFLNSIVDRIPPAEHANHINILEMFYEADSKVEDLKPENSQVESYKNQLKNRPAIAPLNSYANKANASMDDDEKAEHNEVKTELAKQIAAGKQTNYGIVLKEIMEAKRGN